MTLTAFFETALSLSLHVTLLILVTAWLVRCSRSENTGDRLWQVCHVLILLLFVAAFALPHLRLMPHSLLLDLVNRDAALTFETRFGMALAWMWLAGTAISVGALILNTIHIRRVLSASRPIAREVFVGRGLRTPDGLQGGRTIRWLQSDFAAGPFCWQLHQPLIILPTFVLEFDDDELQAVIDHEVAHLTAGHPLGLFLQRLVEMLLWFHPAVWWASWHAAAQREYVCDRWAAQSANEASACLRSLLRLAEQRTVVTVGLLAGLPFIARKSLIRMRAARLSQFDAPRTLKTIDRVAILLLVTASAAAYSLQLPLDVMASNRSVWSPWPTWSSRALQSVGLSARDYEIDNHRDAEHNH